jgi:hypothetical protein
MSDDDKELEIRMSKHVQDQIEQHPERAEQVRELMARLRQALEGVNWKDKDSVMSAMESIGVERVRDPDELARLDEIADDEGGDGW